MWFFDNGQGENWEYFVEICLDILVLSSILFHITATSSCSFEVRFEDLLTIFETINQMF